MRGKGVRDRDKKAKETLQTGRKEFKSTSTLFDFLASNHQKSLR